MERIDELWDVLKLLGTGYNSVSRSLADGKYEYSEIFADLTAVGSQVPGAIAGSSTIPATVKTITDEEIDELQRRFVQHFNLPEGAEDRVNAAIDALQLIVGDALPKLQYALTGE
jgi:hypothetical protein